MRGRPRAVAAAVAIAATGCGPAAAADGSIIGIAPADASTSWLMLGVPAGGEARGTVIVINHTDAPQAVSLSASDATTTADGVFTLAGEGARPTGVGAWARPAARRLVLAPRERRPVGYSLTVPPGTEPGDYAGGLVARSDAPAGHGEAGGVAIDVVERVGLRIYQTVPGRRDGSVAVAPPELRTAGASGVRAVLGLPTEVRARMTVRHRGNVRYDALGGTVDLVQDDRVVASTPLEVGTLLPGASREVSVRLPLPGMPTGDYTVRVRVNSTPPIEATARLGVGGGRVWGAGGLVVVGLMGASGAAFRRRGRDLHLRR